MVGFLSQLRPVYRTWCCDRCREGAIRTATTYAYVSHASVPDDAGQPTEVQGLDDNERQLARVKRL
jgi:hypothetical protein